MNNHRHICITLLLISGAWLVVAQGRGIYAAYPSVRRAMEKEGGEASVLMRPLSLRLFRTLKPGSCSRSCSSRDSSGSKSFNAGAAHSAHPPKPIADESIDPIADPYLAHSPRPDPRYNTKRADIYIHVRLQAGRGLKRTRLAAPQKQLSWLTWPSCKLFVDLICPPYQAQWI